MKKYLFILAAIAFLYACTSGSGQLDPGGSSSTTSSGISSSSSSASSSSASSSSSSSAFSGPAPAAPTGFAYSNIGNQHIHVYWQDNATNETEYYLYFSSSASKPVVVYRTLPAGSEGFIFSNVLINVTYYVWIESHNPTGSSSDLNLSYSINGPSIPLSFNVAFNTNTQEMDLSWTAPAQTNVMDGYHIYYSTVNSQPGSPNVTLPVSALSHSISGLTTNVKYYFWIASYETSFGDSPVLSDNAYFGARVKSPKRGIAYNLSTVPDMQALSGGVSWWYNWSPQYDGAVAAVYESEGMDWVPMTWNGNNATEIRNFLDTHPNVKYLLGYNEPNFRVEANMTPAYAASIWPQFESIANDYGLELVGPAVNYCGDCWDGNPGGGSVGEPTFWIDLFIAEYKSQNGGADPRIDYMALHWYDFGVIDRVNEMITKYGKPVWLTEWALWRYESWNTPEFQKDWMLERVNFLETNDMVFRYSWFTGRRGDFPIINLLGADGQLTELGQAYVDAPF